MRSDASSVHVHFNCSVRFFLAFSFSVSIVLCVSWFRPYGGVQFSSLHSVSFLFYNFSVAWLASIIMFCVFSLFFCPSVCPSVFSIICFSVMFWQTFLFEFTSTYFMLHNREKNNLSKFYLNWYTYLFVLIYRDLQFMYQGIFWEKYIGFLTVGCEIYNPYI